MAAKRYVANVPRKVPEGRIVVHNHIAPAAEIGFRGFRVWTEPGRALPRRTGGVMADAIDRCSRCGSSSNTVQP